MIRNSNVRRGLVPGAALLTGAAGALSLILAQRYLGLDAFAPLAQLWTIWAVCAAGLTFSFQQWAAIYEIDRSTILPGHLHQRVLVWLVGAGAVAFVVVYTGRDRLFHSTEVIWPIAAALLPVGTAYNGIRRGQLARRRQRGGLATVIFGENAIRLIVSVAFIAVGASAPWFALALLSGFVVILGPVGRPVTDANGDGGESGVASLGAAAAAGFLAYAFMFGSPILLTLAGGTAVDVSALFLVLTGVRMPFVVLQAVVPQLAESLSSAPDQAGRVRHVRRIVAISAILGSIAAAIAGYVLGDLVIGQVFGIRGEIEPSTYGLLAAASVLSACSLVATVILVVQGRTWRIAAAWGIPALSAIVMTATGLIVSPNALALWLLVAHATVAAVSLAPTRERARRARGSARQPIA